MDFAQSEIRSAEYSIEGDDEPEDTLIAKLFIFGLSQKLECEASHHWNDYLFRIGITVNANTTFRNALESAFELKPAGVPCYNKQCISTNKTNVLEFIDNFAEILMVEVKYLDKDNQLMDFKTKEIKGQDYVKQKFEVQDYVDLTVYQAMEAAKQEANVKYELFAAISIDSTALQNCQYVSAVKKRCPETKEFQWYIFSADE